MRQCLVCGPVPACSVGVPLLSAPLALQHSLPAPPMAALCTAALRSSAPGPDFWAMHITTCAPTPRWPSRSSFVPLLSFLSGQLSFCRMHLLLWLHLSLLPLELSCAGIWCLQLFPVTLFMVTLLPCWLHFINFTTNCGLILPQAS